MTTQKLILMLVCLQVLNYFGDALPINTMNQMTHLNRTDFVEYHQVRNNLLKSECESRFGSDLELSPKEDIANKIIMAAKNNELDIGLVNPKHFIPAQHIFNALKAIEKSKLFKIIQKMPKGGILHTHDLSMCSADYVLSLTYLPNLWQRTSNNSDKIQELRFSKEKPTNEANSSSTWQLVQTVRTKLGAENYDSRLRSMLTLFDENVNPRTQFTDIIDVWPSFGAIFNFVTPLLNYVPARRAYYKRTLQEMLDDGVQYVEFRYTPFKRRQLYDLENEYDKEHLVKILMETLDEFKRENPSFIGSKLIYTGNKWLSRDMIADQFATVQHLHAKFPQFVGGFDLSNLEDKSPLLLIFAEQILELPKEIPLLFHAGETNWFGSIDESLYDAILLGSRRIGHGYALSKHPKLMDLVKKKDIALEINPISNQVLRLVDDLRNHPASTFLAQNVSVVISSDNLGFWEVSPLSHDFYVAFLGIASRHADLRTLKKFALNSIAYSLMNETEKNEAYVKWQKKWDTFIDDLVDDECSSEMCTRNSRVF